MPKSNVMAPGLTTWRANKIRMAVLVSSGFAFPSSCCTPLYLNFFLP